MKVPSLFSRGGGGGRGPADHVALRLVLYEREAFRVPRSCPGIRVMHGEAWITFDGKDTIAARGEEVRLQPGRGFAVVSALGSEDLVVEVLARGQRPTSVRERPSIRSTARC